MQVYLDNAATTAPYPEVLEAMTPYLRGIYGNPSSLHASGRKARAAIELARKSIAKLIGATSAEIIFTSGGTEADNIFLQGIAREVPHIISSPIEHPAVLETLTTIEEDGISKVSWLKIDEKGQVSLENLREELEINPKALVVLMHGNNEIGNLLPLQNVSQICQEHNALLFSDAVQTVGHYVYDVNNLNITGLAASAHKFNGPKGVGFLYLKQGTKLSSLYHGGEQERGVSVGTENVAGIIGMATALEISYSRLEGSKEHIQRLKARLVEQLKIVFEDVKFNGNSESLDNSIYTLISVSFPKHEQNEMLLFNLDLNNIAVSAGSACASGASKDSHVLEALKHNPERGTIRFSFSHTNSIEEIDFVIEKLKMIFDTL